VRLFTSANKGYSMSDQQPTHEFILRQMSILIYNQPAVQAALTEVSKATRRREGLTDAGVAFVIAVTETAMALNNPESMQGALSACPTTAAAAATKPGIYPAISIGDGDTILHGGVERVVAKVMAGREEVQFTLDNGALVSVLPATQIRLIKAYEPDI
jgi:hypothetical protein